MEVNEYEASSVSLTKSHHFHCWPQSFISSLSLKQHFHLLHQTQISPMFECFPVQQLNVFMNCEYWDLSHSPSPQSPIYVLVYTDVFQVFQCSFHGDSEKQVRGSRIKEKYMIRWMQDQSAGLWMQKQEVQTNKEVHQKFTTTKSKVLCIKSSNLWSQYIHKLSSCVHSEAVSVCGSVWKFSSLSWCGHGVHLRSFRFRTCISSTINQQKDSLGQHCHPLIASLACYLWRQLGLPGV